jgi:circadian clock protein KaiC
MEYCSSGIPNLDEVLGGGLPKPSMILIGGPPGVGKTTFALQSLSKAAENGEKALYLPFTSQSVEKLTDFLHSYHFFNDDVIVHPIDRSTAEKDPLTTLLDIGNILASTNPDRLVLNPLTTLGFGFSQQERRRFFYSFDSMLQDWSAQTLVTGEMSRTDVDESILSNIADGVIFLDRDKVGKKKIRKLEVVKFRAMSAAPDDRSSIYEFKIGSEGIYLFPKLKSHTTHQPLNGNKLSTGVEGLDEMMHGGLPKQSILLVAGGAGLGKSTLGLQFIMAGLRMGEPGVIVIFEEQDIQFIFEASRMGWDLQKYIDNGLLRIVHSNPYEILPAEHNLQIKGAIEEIGAKRLFMDGIYNLEIALPESLALKEHIMLLTDFLKYQGITALLSNEVTELSNLNKMPELGVSSIADAILVLHFVEEGSRFERVLSIVKLRGSDHDRTIRKYNINNKGIEII